MLHLRLHAKFLVLILGSLAILLAVLLFAVVRREAELLARKAEETQHALAFTVISDLKSSMMRGRPRSTLGLMNTVRGTHGLVRLEALRADGSPVFETQGERYDIPQLKQAFLTGEEISFREKGDVPLHTILYPLKNEKECVACHGRQKNILGVLLISLSLEDTVKEIETSTRKLTLFLLALILLIGTVLYLMVRKVVLKPLAILHDGAERIGKGELMHRISLSTNDEIQRVAQSFNLMAARLQEFYGGLEDRIRERTTQLTETMAEVEEKARQLYEYSRSMAAISRLSTKVFNAEQSFDELLDRFMGAVVRGLGYKRSLLCLVDRKRAWLEVKRDTGLGAVLRITSQSLSGKDPFVSLVRTGRALTIDDISRDPVLGGYRQNDAEPCALHIIPILSGTHGKRCRQAKSCVRTDCPAYNSENEMCWLIENTLCGNTLIESYGDKLSYCMSCEVFPVLGVLVVAAEHPPLKRRDVSVLRILAAEMGAALENHRLHDDNRHLVKEFIELHKVTAGVLADLSLDRALEAFIDSAVKFPGLDACNFWLLSEDGRELIHRAGGCPGTGPEENNVCPERVPSDEGVLGRSFKENVIITEYHALSDDTTEPGAATAALDMPSLLAVPLTTESRPIGVFSVHKKSITPFLETEIAAFMLLANHAAMAINVCLLNEELNSQNRELAKSTSLMGGILSSMSNGVMLLDMTGTVQLINQAGAALLHVRSQEVMNRPLADIFPDAAVFLKTSAGPYHETAIRRRDGSSIPVGFSIACYNEPSGEREGTIVVYRDLTEIKELQTAVLNKERFAAMGQVVAGVAHEIRNPLFGISSIGQIFERELQNPGHLELVKALLSETKRLNRLVEDLLIYGRPTRLSLARCDLMALWEEVIGMHREELAQKGITIKGDYNIGHTPAFLDANQIRQVFLNLIRNAIDATPPEAEITIRVLLEDNYIIFKIADTGSGISPDNINKVFDLFFTTKPKGSGLGLAICKKIIEDHGGSIHLESRQGEWLREPRGTTVTVKLPYRGDTGKHQ